MDVYALGLQKREKTLKPTVIPSKSHSVAVFIISLEIFAGIHTVRLTSIYYQVLGYPELSWLRETS